MYIKEGALVLGLHDLDHVIGAQTEGPASKSNHEPGSDWFLRALDESGELFLSGLIEIDDERSIKHQLQSLGVERIVIELGKLGVLNPGGSEMRVQALRPSKPDAPSK